MPASTNAKIPIPTPAIRPDSRTVMGTSTQASVKRNPNANVTFQPKNMSPERLQRGYLELWRDFYRGRDELRSREHHARTIQF